ncbi:MAG: hypothetical protein PWQ09_1508, partial [Candidatus Cloacimonadota bacterium]|nr:hypothetical protein [Candidatus Cloacimonadota bacterium]
MISQQSKSQNITTKVWFTFKLSDQLWNRTITFECI